MYEKFFINDDDITMCCVQIKTGGYKYFAMSDSVPIPVNAAETLPGKAGAVSKEEFMKKANPDAVGMLERLYF